MPHSVIMPKTGMAMEEGTIVRWRKAVGDTVSKGKAIAWIGAPGEKVEQAMSAAPVAAPAKTGQAQAMPLAARSMATTAAASAGTGRPGASWPSAACGAPLRKR